MWESLNQFLEQPVKVWHLVIGLIILGSGIGGTLADMRRQMSAIGESVWRIVDRLEGNKREDS